MEERLCLGRGSRQRELAGWRLRSGVQRASEGGGQSCGVGLQEGREVPGGLLPKPCPFPSQDPLPIPGGPALTWLEFRPGSAALWEDQEYQCHLWCDCPWLLCCVLPRAVLEGQSMQGRGQQPPPHCHHAHPLCGALPLPLLLPPQPCRGTVLTVLLFLQLSPHRWTGLAVSLLCPL